MSVENSHSVGFLHSTRKGKNRKLTAAAPHLAKLRGPADGYFLSAPTFLSPAHLPKKVLTLPEQCSNAYSNHQIAGTPTHLLGKEKGLI